VALLRERAGAEEGRLDCLLNPGRPLDPRAAAVNGLRDDDLAAAPPFASVAPAVEALAAGAVLVGHNLAFDLAFLGAELGALGRPPLARPSLDTLPLARRLLRKTAYNLTALAAGLGLPPPSHRAMADVLALQALFHHLRALMAELGATTLGDALRLERGVLPGTPEPEAPPLIAQALAEGRAIRIVYHSRGSPEPTTRTIRPIYLSRERSGVFLRAFCELRQDVRAFAVAKIAAVELLEGPAPARDQEGGPIIDSPRPLLYTPSDVTL
jgi:DNA polymerase-3 subunit epsilon